MDKNAVDSLVIGFESLDYTDKLSAYNKTFSLGKFQSDNMNDKLVLISLVVDGKNVISPKQMSSE